jgi:hypothetical protein
LLRTITPEKIKAYYKGMVKGDVKIILVEDEDAVMKNQEIIYV